MVGAAPTGDTPTISELSTILLNTYVRLISEVWRYLIHTKRPRKSAICARTMTVTTHFWCAVSRPRDYPMRDWLRAWPSLIWWTKLVSVATISISPTHWFDNIHERVWDSVPLKYQDRNIHPTWRLCLTYGGDVDSCCYLRLCNLCRSPWLTSSGVLWNVCSVAYLILSGHVKGKFVCFWPYIISSYILP